MSRAMKPKARAAIAIQSGSPSRAPALASAAIINPFQSARTLSSSPGLTRFSRSSNSLPRSIFSEDHSIGDNRSESMLRGKSLSRFKMLCPSKFPSGVTSYCAAKNAASSRRSTLLDLGQRPDVELALLAFGIGIERGREGALRRRHLAHQPADRLCGALAEERAVPVATWRGRAARGAARCRRASSRSAARASARRPSSARSRRRDGRRCRPRRCARA